MDKKIDWEDPYYTYRRSKHSRKPVITIDVTGSAPNFENPIDGVSDVVAEFKNRDFSTILDFGAGKLRHTLYLLKQGFTVWAVEFKEVFDRNQGALRLKAAEKFSGFFYLEYPKDFLAFEEELDAALVINVVNIVPEQSDRRKILRECAKRLKKGGLLLVATQYGEPHYRPGMTNRVSLNDGWAYKLRQKYQTFNREYKYPELLDLVQKKLYKPDRKIKSKNHKAYLFVRR